jgi:hypothetical protein
MMVSKNRAVMNDLTSLTSVLAVRRMQKGAGHIGMARACATGRMTNVTQYLPSILLFVALVGRQFFHSAQRVVIVLRR